MAHVASLAHHGPQIRLFDPHSDPDSDPGIYEPQPGEDPRLTWTLEEFFTKWVVPNRLSNYGRAAGTLRGYIESLRYWRGITGNPCLGHLEHDVTDQITTNFTDELVEWGFCRRGVRKGEPIFVGRRSEHPSYLALTPKTASNHASRIAYLIRTAGQRIKPREEVARILTRVPFIRYMPGDFAEKPPFEIDEARRFAAACPIAPKPALPEWMPRELWWKTRLGTFYYTGIRAGTVCNLRWRHVLGLALPASELWLSIPSADVTKTRKPVKMPLHPQLSEMVREVRARRETVGPVDPDELLLPAGCCYRHFMTLHKTLQAAAGLESQQSPHAWRRTHLVQMATLGADKGHQVAQWAADHSDGRTTRESYIHDALVNQLRLELPPLF